MSFKYIYITIENSKMSQKNKEDVPKLSEQDTTEEESENESSSELISENSDSETIHSDSESEEDEEEDEEGTANNDSDDETVFVDTCYEAVKRIVCELDKPEINKFMGLLVQSPGTSSHKKGFDDELLKSLSKLSIFLLSENEINNLKEFLKSP